MIKNVIKFLNQKLEQLSDKLEQETEQNEQKSNQNEKIKEPKAQKQKLSLKAKINKGKEYEYYLKTYYEKLEYKVYPNGYIKGVKDGGIDLIAYKDNEILLIQAKNWANSPKQKDLKAFLVDCENYIKENEQKIKNKKIIKIFATTNEKIDYGVECFLKELKNKDTIEYKIIKIENKI